MALRFRSPVKLLPGVSLSHDGTSWTVARRAGSLFLRARGLYADIGRPGVGLNRHVPEDDLSHDDRYNPALPQPLPYGRLLLLLVALWYLVGWLLG